MAWTCPACGFRGDDEQPPDRCLACDAGLAERLAPRPSGGDEDSMSRRRFFQAVGMAAGLGAAGGAAYMAFRFLQPAAPLESPANVVLDAPSSYAEGRTFIESALAFVERRGSQVRCISAECTHLGCPVKWDDARQIYHCPCHDSDFSAEGERLRGPASKALPFLSVSLDADGRLTIHRKRTVARGKEWLDVG